MMLFGISYEGYDDVMVLPHRISRCLLFKYVICRYCVWSVCPEWNVHEPSGRGGGDKLTGPFAPQIALIALHIIWRVL